LDEYLAVRRAGRVKSLQAQQRELVWNVAMNGRLATWSHRRMAALEVLRAAATSQEPPFTHLFIDEFQDMTPADFEFATLVVGDPNQIVVAGDETQSLHLGAACRRPGRLSIPAPYRRAGQPTVRQWNEHPLTGSYRLPVRACECVAPLAKAIEASRVAEEGKHDVTLPNAQKSAVLGVRPIVVTAETATTTVPQVISTYGALLDSYPKASRIITIAEGDLDTDTLAPTARPLGCEIERRSMRDMKGLERPCVIWPTSAPLQTDEAELEWIYTILTRATALTLIIVDADRTPTAARLAMAELDRRRLLFWDELAEGSFDQAIDRRRHQTLSRLQSEPVPRTTAPRSVGADQSAAGTVSEAEWVFDEPSSLSAEAHKGYALRQPGIFDEFPRAYSSWSIREDDHLRMLYSRGLLVEQIAALHRRQPSAIRSRLRKLGLMDATPVASGGSTAATPLLPGTT
jgi:hypothetical protein